MHSFNYQNPTKIIYGNDAIDHLSQEVLNFGNKVLMVYGGNSFKSSGTFDLVTKQFQENNIDYVELPNTTKPTLQQLYKGIALAKENEVDVVLGFGGGCCIDMAKSIAVGARNEYDIWDILTKKISTNHLDVLPIGAIVTIAGSGSEMDGNSEIDNEETGEHGSIGSFLKTYPTFSILDPKLTINVPWTLTAYHGQTIIAQAMEQYLNDVNNTPIQNGFVETICKTVIESLRILKKNPQNLDARGNLMWASAITCNRILGRGKNAPWLGGPLGGLIDDTLGLTYSQGIAITWPKYLMTCYKEYVQTLKSFAINVMNIEAGEKDDERIALEGTIALQKFYDDMGLAHTVKDLGCGHHTMTEFKERIDKLASRNVISKEDIQTIVSLSLG